MIGGLSYLNPVRNINFVTWWGNPMKKAVKTQSYSNLITDNPGEQAHPYTNL